VTTTANTDNKKVITRAELARLETPDPSFKAPGFWQRLFGPWPEPCGPRQHQIKDKTFIEREVTWLNLDRFIFRDVRFYRVDFTNVFFRWGKFADCTFEICSFADCNLDWAEFRNCRFSDVSFINTSLQWAKADEASRFDYIKLDNTTHSPNTAPALSRDPGSWSRIELKLQDPATQW
jgi:hypothetical protein